MDVPALPGVFPVGTLFAVIDGVPVTESPDGQMLRWDLASPSPISSRGASSRAVPVSESTFRTLIAAYWPCVTADPRLVPAAP